MLLARHPKRTFAFRSRSARLDLYEIFADVVKSPRLQRLSSETPVIVYIFNASPPSILLEAVKGTPKYSRGFVVCRQHVEQHNNASLFSVAQLGRPSSRSAILIINCKIDEVLDVLLDVHFRLYYSQMMLLQRTTSLQSVFMGCHPDLAVFEASSRCGPASLSSSVFMTEIWLSELPPSAEASLAILQPLLLCVGQVWGDLSSRSRFRSNVLGYILSPGSAVVVEWCGRSTTFWLGMSIHQGFNSLSDLIALLKQNPKPATCWFESLCGSFHYRRRLDEINQLNWWGICPSFPWLDSRSVLWSLSWIRFRFCWLKCRCSLSGRNKKSRERRRGENQ